MVSLITNPGSMFTPQIYMLHHNINFLKCVHAKLLQSCPSLCNPMDHSWLGSSVQGILQGRILGGLPCPPPGDLPNPGFKPRSHAAYTGRWVL